MNYLEIKVRSPARKKKEKKSTIAALQALRKLITRTFKVKQFAFCAFIDIAGAFDNTSFDAIAKALQKKRC